MTTVPAANARLVADIAIMHVVGRVTLTNVSSTVHRSSLTLY
jgi:hypothetical protein